MVRASSTNDVEKRHGEKLVISFLFQDNTEEIGKFHPFSYVLIVSPLHDLRLQHILIISTNTHCTHSAHDDSRRSSSFYRNSPPGVRPGSGGAGCEQTYNPGGPRADLPTKHSFIELASGSRISIGVRILDGFPLGEGHNAACFKCFVNGNRISSLVVTSENWAREGICLMKIPRTGSKFIFAPGTQYETFHAETFRCDSLHAKNLGTVEVVVASGKSTGPSATFPSAPSEENLRFRTESLADKTKSHAINYQGNVCNPSKQQLLKVEEPREYVSRFIFRTRTKEELQSLLVILRGLISEVEIEAHRWDLSQGELRRIAAD
ncbi:hypothetical protein FIE12Z_2773 [Fusarium flagelliforme]|uniref:DUF7918 domain-containing protein n=1 Tax=Fusarium flagelliforme TaxID=2675880 RepID=A0A395MYK4_9HYPO|nr:hypothetical protein FIE12Z_2773 [Fusarium flagelliforme]